MASHPTCSQRRQRVRNLSLQTLNAIRREAQEKAAADVERGAIVGCLEKPGWGVELAVRLTGYSRVRFYRLVQKHAISRQTQ